MSGAEAAATHELVSVRLGTAPGAESARAWEDPEQTEFTEKLLAEDDIDTSAVLESQYDFHRALFSRAFLYFVTGRIISWQMALYIAALTLASTLAGLCVCNADKMSILLGRGFCWSPTYAFSWADMTLSGLCAFLLGLLVNNVLTRWWTTRTLIQDLINNMGHLLFLLKMAREPFCKVPQGETENYDQLYIEAFRRIKCRLVLAFELMILAASTYKKKDTDSHERVKKFYMVREGIIAGELEGSGVGDKNGVALDGKRETFKEVMHIHPALWVYRKWGTKSMLADDLRNLNLHRHPTVPLSWALGDVQALEDRGILSRFRVNDIFGMITKLRTALNDVPFWVGVQLPFVAVSTVACTVHLTLFQLCYISANYIGVGLTVEGQGAKALAGFCSCIFVSFM